MPKSKQKVLQKKLEEIPETARNFYQKFAGKEEEIERISYHYEVDPKFFLTITGGEWNTYSCSLWGEKNMTLTEAQEKKLDLYAELMELKPGMKILDVGCGWGGPLVYLCHKYGVSGHGITISPMAITTAEQRVHKYGVDATFEVVHWEDLNGEEVYDAVFTDEVIVHFNNLEGFFNKVYKLLKKDGVMVNKELHFTNSDFAHANDRLSQHINKVYGYTGNYLTLSKELSILDKSCFKLSQIVDIPMDYYNRTIKEYWLKYIQENKEGLVSLTNKKHVRDFILYLKGTIRVFNHGNFGMHIIKAKKM